MIIISSVRNFFLFSRAFYRSVNIRTKLDILTVKGKVKHIPCLSCSAGSATNVISLALYSVSHVFHLALNSDISGAG